MITIDSVKMQFFTKERMKEFQSAVNKGLVRAAALTRTIARRSMKPAGAGRKKSRPGEPPRYHTKLLRQHLYFWANRKEMSVEIGPARLTGTASQDIPGNLEQGGKGIRPRPYMGPALDLAKEQLKDVLTG